MRDTILPLGYHTDEDLYDSQGVYFDLGTASEVFIILTTKLYLTQRYSSLFNIHSYAVIMQYMIEYILCLFEKKKKSNDNELIACMIKLSEESNRSLGKSASWLG